MNKIQVSSVDLVNYKYLTLGDHIILVTNYFLYFTELTTKEFVDHMLEVCNS